MITNAMRLLRAAGIPFDIKEYEVDENDLSGVHIAESLGISPDCMFKTLVARGAGGGIYVFCIPAASELDLKKCASLVGEKSVEMVHVKELLGLTGYIRGGCSPVGMKKKYPTYMDETATLFSPIYVSAGVRGAQLAIDPEALADFAQIVFADLIKY
ncbi:MAG: Cys-tRNA(Pro) deacylase [Ruminococcaceae bacterium]|nr:Cys-tRNA(Pro) deacylase [Oscillospiraceae bacterium]